MKITLNEIYISKRVIALPPGITFHQQSCNNPDCNDASCITNKNQSITEDELTAAVSSHNGKKKAVCEKTKNWNGTHH